MSMAGHLFLPGDYTETLNSLLATRYLTLSGIVILLWDTFLAFPMELRYVWQTKITIPKLGYVTNRYLVCVFMLILVNDIVVTGTLSDQWVHISLNSIRCAYSIAILAILVFLADAIGHALVIFRLFVMWNKNERVLRMIILGSIVVNAISVVFIVMAVRHLFGNAQFIEILNFKACSVDIRPKLILGIWAAQIAFDVYALVLVFLNAMDKPRVQGQKIWKMLYEDGIFLITITFILRLLNLILCSLDKPALSMLGISFVESVITAINGRLLLNVFKLEHPSESLDVLRMDTPVSDGYSMKHLSDSSSSRKRLISPYSA